MSTPTTRSRTLLFISFRDSRVPSTRFQSSSYSDEPYRAEDENETLIHLPLDSELPPKWYSLFRPVSDSLDSFLIKG
jgi:syntaxin 16